MVSLIGHTRVAARTLAARPGLAFGRILTLAAVVTAVTAVFTVAQAIFLRPLPFPEAHRLVQIFMQPPGTEGFQAGVSHPPVTYLRLRERVRTFERFEGLWIAERAIAGDGEPESVRAARTSAGFFAMLGAVPIAGRVFTDREVTDDARVVVVGSGFWQRRFGGQRSALGRSIVIDGEPHTIIGILDAEFNPAFSLTEFWTPLNLRAFERQPSSFVRVIGLLRSGVAAHQALTELNGLLPPVQEEMPVLNGWRIGVVELREAAYGSQRPAVLMLIAAVAGLSLLAIANLANLTLADVMFRHRDFAVRAALGASRVRIAAPEVAQGLAVAAAGGTVGLAGASLLVPALLALDPSNGLAREQLGVGWRVALFAIGAAATIMSLAVAGPVLRFAGPRLATDLTSRSRGATGGRSPARTRTSLVVVQTGLALVLLASSAVIVATLQRTSTIDPGFDPANVVTAQLRLPAGKYPTEADRTQFVERMLEAVRATPGIVSAGTTINPFTVGGSFISLVQIEDRPRPDGQPYSVQFRRISPGYLETVRVPLVTGRDFTVHDRAGAQPVALISRSMAERFWPGGDPIGKRIRRGAAPQWLSVVGVVGDVRDLGLDVPPADTIYTPVFQGSATAVTVSLVVRTQVPPRASIPDVRKAVWQVDPGQPLANVVTLEAFLASTLGPQRFRAAVIAVCGSIGLLLATIGVYGVTTRSVLERRREIGIRLALGGQPRSVWWRVAATSLRAVAGGVVLGVIMSALAREGLAALLPEFEEAGLGFCFAAAGVLFAVGAIAAMAAARGAGAVDPLTALRSE